LSHNQLDFRLENGETSRGNITLKRKQTIISKEEKRR
jgi:hypothetical protein